MVNVYSPEYLYTSDNSPVQYGSIYEIKHYLKHERLPGLRGYLRDLDEYAKLIQLGTHQGVTHRKGGSTITTSIHTRMSFSEVYGRGTASVVKLNDEYVFVLLVINVQTRMLYFRPLYGKRSGKGVAEALKGIFMIDIQSQIEGFSEILLHYDHGKEFYNANVADVVEQLHIHLYASHSDNKAAVIERVIRTIRGRLVKAMEMKGEQWIALIAH